MTLKPSLYLAFSLSLLALPVQAKPACWQVQPGPAPDPALVAWWQGGKRLLETPAAWDVQRVYQELESYGFCAVNPKPSTVLESATVPAEPVQQVRSSTEIIRERRDQYQAQKASPSTPNSLGDLVFLGGLIAAIFVGLKGSKNELLETEEQQSRRFFSSGVTEASPWLADQVAPARSGSLDMDAGDRTPAPAHAPTPKHTQGCAPSVNEVCDSSHHGVNPSVNEVWKLTPEQARHLWTSAKPFPAHNIHDDDTLVKSVIRVGIVAGFNKASVLEAFYWVKPESEDTWVKTPVTKGTNNKPYTRFSDLFDDVLFEEKQRRQQS